MLRELGMNEGECVRMCLTGAGTKAEVVPRTALSKGKNSKVGGGNRLHNIF